MSRRIAIAAAVALAAAVGAAPAAADYATGLDLGSQAYQYGFPVLDTQRVFATSTSVNVPDGRGGGPVNRFSHIRKLSDASEKTVVAPNNETPYSMAWLDLSRGPVVLHAPPIHRRFWEFELLDPWTNNFFNITSASAGLGRGDFGVTGGGNWAVVGPHFHGRLPRGVRRVRSRYDRVWVIGRTYLRGRSDLPALHRIQDGYAITPLSRWGTRYRPKRPRHPDRTSTQATIPGTVAGEDPLAFFAALGRQLRRFPPPAADRPLLAKLKAVGIGPGLDPRSAGLDPETLQGLRDAVTQGPGKLLAGVLARFAASFDAHDGYFVSDLGAWGTDYQLRAIGARVGLGGQRANVATYPFTLTDHMHAPLTGSARYVLHLPADRLPIPVRAFWSLTLYDAGSFFVANPLNRYALNSRSRLHRNADGSIDLYIQHGRPVDPAQAANWLPAPAPGEGFRLIWRLYDLGPALRGVLDGSGWQPPAVQPCDDSGRAPDGTACAA